MQRKIINKKTNDEKVQEAILKGIDENIDIFVKQVEALKRNINDFEMQINQLNFQRKKIIKDGWNKALK